MTYTLPILEKSKAPSLPIYALNAKQFAPWLKQQTPAVKQWLQVNAFKAAAGTYCLIPAKDGTIAGVACGVSDTPDLWSLAHLPMQLPAGNYHLEGSFTASVDRKPRAGLFAS